MRKNMLIICFVLVALLLSSCGGGQATQAPGAATEQPAATQAMTEAPPAGEKVTLTIESWRNDDLQIWQDTIIPAFEAKYPNIHVEFAPTAPAEYNGVLNTKLEGGTAGDLITCRPFDASLAAVSRKATWHRSTICLAWRISAMSPRAPGSPTTARMSSACRWPP